MNTTHEALEEVQRIVLSDERELIVPAGLLIRRVYDATEHNLWVPGVPNQPDTTPDVILRSALTYCYVTGIFSSSDIEAAASHDPAVRYICANYRPRWETIREFRRKNMPGLTLALARLLGSSVNANDIAWNDHQSEARRRLARAIQADSHALDI